jgi:hypothetical protein
MIINDEYHANHCSILLLFTFTLIRLACKHEILYHEQMGEHSEAYES